MLRIIGYKFRILGNLHVCNELCSGYLATCSVYSAVVFMFGILGYTFSIHSCRFYVRDTWLHV